MEKRYKINLSLPELLLIDGKVVESEQLIINIAKKEAGYGFPLPVMNEILRKSEETGELKWQFKSIENCLYCDKKHDYFLHKRSGRFHRRGEKDYSKPKHYSGIKFNEGFISIQGMGDMCTDCADSNNVIHTLIDYILDNDLKIEIQQNDYKPTRYKKDRIYVCYNCGKEMQESSMGWLNAIMQGKYRGECPYCKAKQLFLGPSHKFTKKWVMVLSQEVSK